MKGIVYTEFGPPEVLKIMDLETPKPKDNQVLIKVKAASMYYLDYMRFTKQVDGGKTPFSTKLIDKKNNALGKVIGCELSGIVEEVGKTVTQVKKGDEVFAVATGLSGALAEYALADETTVFLKPSNLSFEESATIPVAGISALGAVRTAGVKEGQSVLIYGASGGVGQFAVQLSKAVGATVTAVCSTRNIEIAHEIGADYVIDYKQEDFRKKDITYDVIIGVNGYNPIKQYKRLLNEGGVYVAVGGVKQGMMGGLFGPLYSNKSKTLTFSTYFDAIKQPCLPYLKELAEDGKIKPYVESVCSAKDTAKAVRQLCKNHAQGKIAFVMDL